MRAWIDRLEPDRRSPGALVDMPRHLQHRSIWAQAIPAIAVGAVFGAWIVAALLLAAR